jgi:hypothetical protein
LRDLHFGFLPDDCEDEFTDCFERIGKVKIKLKVFKTYFYLIA